MLEDRLAMEPVRHTIVTVVTKGENGRVVVIDQGLKYRVYTSEYWGAKPDGEYELYVNQGGIRNRDVPRNEKDALVRFLRIHFNLDEEGNMTFNGVIRLLVVGGEITQIRLEHK